VSDQPVRPHQTAVTVTVQLGTAADILLETFGRDITYPSLSIVHDGLTLIVEPYGPSEGGPVTECDVLRGRELAQAAEEYYQRLERQLEEHKRKALEHERTMTNLAQETEPPVVRIRHFLEHELPHVVESP